MRKLTITSLLTLLVMGLGMGCQTARTSAASEAAPHAAASPLAESRQLILVTSEDWDASKASLRRFERAKDGTWRPVGDAVAVTVGRNGLAWGRGLHGGRLSDAPVKKEGDGRAPAGVFVLPGAFAYLPGDIPSPKVPVYGITDHSVCVDDMNSSSYNRTFEETTVTQKDWSSEERMLRPDGLYRFGIIVGHNAPDATPGAGSCIFMHLWRGPDSPTAGCTAMAEPDMLTILAWLDEGKKPLLVQLPRPEMGRLATAWGAPELAAN